MSQVKINDIFTVGLSGGFGNNTTFRHRKGKTYAFPKQQRGTPSAKQIAIREKFQAAADYAKATLMDPTVLAEYSAIAAQKQFKSPVFTAIIDYLSATKLSKISTEAFKGQVGFHLAIRLADNYKGKELFVSFANKDGTVMESGNASFTFGDDAWKYVTTGSYADIGGLKISVTVKDRIANIAVFEKVLNS